MLAVGGLNRNERAVMAEEIMLAMLGWAAQTDHARPKCVEDNRVAKTHARRDASTDGKEKRWLKLTPDRNASTDGKGKRWLRLTPERMRRLTGR